mmetsp:Transcript_5260/g.9999  ORF Transcript_5260/g.9999 Transcript_5260/m.9999 type:complete len:197 (-) Transcript_5260:175-765(-)
MANDKSKTEGIGPHQLHATVIETEPKAAATSVKESGSQNTVAVETLLPHPMGSWKFSDVCAKCCTCDSACCMAWCCPCFSLGQLAAKMEVIGGTSAFDYRTIVILGVLLTILEAGLGIAFGGKFFFSFASLFYFIVMFQLRTQMRKRLSIPGTSCDDCCCAFFCQPCTLTQMMHQFWAAPAEVPGCDFSEAPAELP